MRILMKKMMKPNKQKNNMWVEAEWKAIKDSKKKTKDCLIKYNRP